MVKYGALDKDVEDRIIDEANKILESRTIDSQYDYILEESLSGIVRYLGKPVSLEEAIRSHRNVFKQYVIASLITGRI